MLKPMSVAVLILISACADPTSPGEAEVRTSISRSGLVVQNSGATPVYYFAVERTAAAVINWAPCSDPDACPNVAARSSATIPFGEIGFWEPTSREAIVFWWRLEPSSEGGFRPDSIRAVVVEK